ncbi:etoposide-induced protein 2.4-domain-containing protein [Mycotypha africana]|uniref:etoposide-induced protein 2.4-domain-containing protein n=1 Tax=Mycotypha africana TaxID=64632 RepID=UPI002301EC23|nr:etoposide-induced protein 2.4-domain-containing protein [Mycotypha africana]KAI8970116.1 etoposide-induced protein 2.4-domain-containing protein [Mycotypha africana]
MLTTFFLNGVFFLGGQIFIETFYPNHKFLGVSYLALLGIPTHFILLTINGKFYSKVAEKAYQIQAQSVKSNPTAGPAAAASTATVSSFASTILTIILYISLGVSANLLAQVPRFGLLLSFLMNCFVMSYYCFEYQWIYKNWNIEKRLSYMESHWAYFLGFGLPGTVITFFLSFLRSSAVFALIYPSFIIMSMLAAPVAPTPYNQSTPSGAKNLQQKEWKIPNKIAIFYPTRKLIDLVIIFVRLVGGIHADSIISEKRKASIKQE